MEDIIDIIVTETTNLIEITSQPTDEVIDVNIIDNREDITLNVTPSVVEININSLTGNFGVEWGDITGTLSNQTDLNTALSLKADLVDGKVPSSQLPSYVDDVVEVANYASLPATGEVGKIYITLDTNFIYRWTGSTYVEIKDSSAVWGAITGTLSSQTDLQNALNAKDAVLTFSSPLSRSTNTISIPAATSSQNGYLTSTDWTTFNNKLSTATAASTYVPYTGATGNVNLGNNDITAGSFTGGTASFATSGAGAAVGINHSSGAGIALNISKSGSGEGIYVNKTSGTGNAVTIIGTLNATTIVKNGGTSSQYLMADGSVSTLTNPITGTGTSGIVAKFNGTSSVTDSIIYDNGTRVSIGADVTTSNKFTAVASTTSSYAVVAQASGAANGFWATLSGTGEIFRGQTSGGSYFIINNGGNAFLNGNLNVGDFASTSYRLNVVGTGNFTGALSGTSATFTSTITSSRNDTGNISMTLSNAYINQGNLINFVHNSGGSTTNGYIGHGGDSTGNIVIINNGITALSLARATGAATFSSSVTAADTISLSNGNLYPRIRVTSTNAGSSSAGFEIADNTGTQWAIAYDKAGSGLQFFKEGSGNRFYITNAGNVGIGTTAPGYNLHVNGTGKFNDVLISTAFESILGSYYYTNLYYSSGFRVRANGYGSFMGLDSSNGNILFATTASGTAGNTVSYSYRFTIKNNGVLNYGNCPTSSAGLSSGDIYSSAGVLMIV